MSLVTNKEKTIIVSQIDLSLIPLVKSDFGYDAGILNSNDKIKWVMPNKSFAYRLGIEQEISKAIILRLGMNTNKPTLGFGSKIFIWNKYNLLWDYAIDPGIMAEGISHNFSWRIKL